LGSRTIGRVNNAGPRRATDMTTRVADPETSSSYKFSGHETFALRYAWLPKAYRLLKHDPCGFSDEDAAMVELGLGKNMVRSLRFWIEAVGVVRPGAGRALDITEFGRAVFGKNGVDPYLEDPRTLWLLHWNLSSRRQGAPFAWQFLLNQWSYPEFTRSEVLNAFAVESQRLGYEHSSVTLGQHLDVFLHTYCGARHSSVGIEDSLDGPLVDLQLVSTLGERKAKDGRWETVYSFRREPKPQITGRLFAFCLADYWDRFRPSDETLGFREIAIGPTSPGQIFKLPEDDVRARLEFYSSAKGHAQFRYQSSAVQGLLTRTKRSSRLTLADVYEERLAHV